MAESELEDLHRDHEGNGLLVGPDCPDCGRRSVATYRCVRCDHRIEVPGEFRWSWQGRGHWHEADDPGWYAAMTRHLTDAHDDRGAFVPVRADEPAAAARPTGAGR